MWQQETDERNDTQSSSPQTIFLRYDAVLVTADFGWKSGGGPKLSVLFVFHGDSSSHVQVRWMSMERWRCGVGVLREQ